MAPHGRYREHRGTGFEPIWAAAEENPPGVGVHVAYCTPLETSGFVYSALMASTGRRLGVFDRFPRLRVAFLEASSTGSVHDPAARGESNRERRRYKPDRPLDRILDRPEQGRGLASCRRWVHRARQIYLGFEVEVPLLQYCLEHFGEDCWLFGSDIPTATGSRMRRRCCSRAPTYRHATRKMVNDNVCRFYGLG